MPRYFYTWSVFWHSPYTQPPAGLPPVLVDGVLAPGSKRWSSRHRPPCVDMISDFYPGYSIGLQSHDTKPQRQVSQRGKESIRRHRLRARLEKKFPLLAPQMYAEALAAKPEYFGTW